MSNKKKGYKLREDKYRKLEEYVKKKNGNDKPTNKGAK